MLAFHKHCVWVFSVDPMLCAPFIGGFVVILHSQDAIRDTGRLVDMPPNELHTDAFREHARHIALLTGSEYEEIVGTELRDRGYGGLWNVGMAADKPPALVILHHKAESSDAKRVALVGKGA